MYPRIGSHHGNPAVVSSAGRSSSFHHTAPPPSSSSGLGIRVAVKPEYRITPPPQLLPQMGDIPRSNFQFDFDFERKVLAEIEKENPDWSRLGLENLPSRSSEALPISGPPGDPVINKYITSGLSREAVPLAVANYGDNPTKVREFVNGYTRLREMGFSSSSIAEALVKNNNNMDEALAYFLSGSS
ncbi:UBA domain-containing protein [Psidium guajava]|nr:UBA domain-containing protein [Psidium guajava]